MFENDLMGIQFAPVIRPKQSRVIKHAQKKSKRQALGSLEPRIEVFVENDLPIKQQTKPLLSSLKTPFYDGKENLDPMLSALLWGGNNNSMPPSSDANHTRQLRESKPVLRPSQSIKVEVKKERKPRFGSENQVPIKTESKHLSPPLPSSILYKQRAQMMNNSFATRSFLSR